MINAGTIHHKASRVIGADGSRQLFLCAAERLGGEIYDQIEVVGLGILFGDHLRAHELAALEAPVHEHIALSSGGHDTYRSHKPATRIGAVADMKVDVFGIETERAVVPGRAARCRRHIGSAIGAHKTLVHDLE